MSNLFKLSTLFILSSASLASAQLFVGAGAGYSQTKFLGDGDIVSTSGATINIEGGKTFNVNESFMLSLEGFVSFNPYNYDKSVAIEYSPNYGRINKINYDQKYSFGVKSKGILKTEIAKFYSSLGFGLARLETENTNTYINDGEVTSIRTTISHKTLVMVKFGLGAEKEIMKNFNIYAEAFMDVALNKTPKVSDDYHVMTNGSQFINTGVLIGARYYF